MRTNIFFQLFFSIIFFNSCNNFNRERELEKNETHILENYLIGNWEGYGGKKFLLGAYITETYHYNFKKEGDIVLYESVRKLYNNNKQTNYGDSGKVIFKKIKNDNGISLILKFLSNTGEDYNYDQSYDFPDENSFKSFFNNLDKANDYVKLINEKDLNSKINFGYYYFVSFRVRSGVGLNGFHEDFSYTPKTKLKLNPLLSINFRFKSKKLYKAKSVSDDERPDNGNFDYDFTYKDFLENMSKSQYKITETNNPFWNISDSSPFSFSFVKNYVRKNRIKYRYGELQIKEKKEILIPFPENHELYKILNTKNDYFNSLGKLFFVLNNKMIYIIDEKNPTKKIYITSITRDYIHDISNINEKSKFILSNGFYLLLEPLNSKKENISNINTDEESIDNKKEKKSSVLVSDEPKKVDKDLSKNKKSVVSRDYFEKEMNSGEWIEYYNNGQLKQIGNYENGIMIGEWKDYYNNGQLKQIGMYEINKYERKVRVGEWKEYYKNGQLKLETSYNYDKYEGIFKEYYENGQLSILGKYIFVQYEPSVKDGGWTEYYKNGQLKRYIFYKNGVLHGEWKEYYENGNLKVSGTFKDGKKKGRWLEFNNVTNSFPTKDIKYK